MTLHKLTALDDPVYDRAAVRKTVDVFVICDRIIQTVDRVVAHYRPDGAASRFGARLASPLLMQFAGNWRVPSVTLYPLDKARRPGSQENPGAGGPRLGLTIRLAGEATPSQEAWADWLRMMPDGIKDVQLQENLHWLLD